MKFDVRTLVFILSLTCVTQVIAIFIQYKINKTYRGIGWWLLGSILMAMGFIFLSMTGIEYVWILAIIGNPLLVLGRICLFIGTIRFIERKEKRWMIITAFIVFNLIYYYYMFGNENLSGRTVVVSAAVAAFSLMTAYSLYSSNNKSLSGSANFTATVFLTHGCYLIVIICYTLIAKPVDSYTNFAPIQIAAFIVPTITSTLWTFGFILMVNQRLNAENLEEKDNLQRVFNTSPDAALITRLADGAIIDVNEGFTVMSGYTRAEIIEKSIIEISTWKELSDYRKFIDDIGEKGSCENLEFVFQRKNRSPFIGIISARIISINKLPHVISVIHDITERKLAEEALRESEETYRSILNASPDDITITDLEGRILMASPAATAMFGYKPGEEDGLHLLDFIVPEDMERARSNLRLMNQGSHQRPNEYRGVRKDRSTFNIEVNSGFIRGAKGQPSKMVFIVRDITERKKVESEKAALEAKNRQLQKAESLGRMAGAIAHHFNNQLQSVMANLDLLSGSPEGVDLNSCLIKAKQASEQAAEVSRLMLSYLGQSSREQEIRLLSELCHDSLPLIQNTLPSNVALETDFPSPGPVISANANQIQQVLVNLVTNAWEAMDDARGNIRLRIKICPAADIPSTHRFPIGWQPQGPDYACLEVMDTGCGIAEEDIEKLFDPFYSTRFTGRGLGLSVVLGIARGHGGVVTVKSQRDRGSTFRIYFPLSTQAMPRLPENLILAPEPKGGGPILLVDDDQLLLESTGALIEMMGFTLLTANDGVEAVEVFRQHQDEIRCVITDLTMPRMDGWGALAALRQLKPTVPVILTSGYDRAEVLSGAHPVRPDAFLGKPFGLKQLQNTINQVLAVSQGDET